MTKQWNSSRQEREKHLCFQQETANCFLLNLPGNGRQVLFSFGLAVAAFVPKRGYIRTSEYYSPTTSKHINAWIGGDHTAVPQSEIDGILYGVPYNEQ